jgi:high-affinity iron transporter
MFRAFVILLREGLEAFLIVAISVAYLRKTGRQHLLSAVYWGIAISILLSCGAAYLFSQAENTSLWEGILGLSAAVLVSTLIVHMWRHGRRMKAEIEGRLAASVQKNSSAAFLGIFLFTLLMITREGMETALLLGTLFFQMSSGSAVGSVTIGALGGLAAASGVAWLWSRYGHRVNLALFFQVTAVFLAVFVVQLFIYGVHELTEANVLPYSDPIHWATEPYGPDGIYGQYLSYALVALPVGWLVFASMFKGRRSTSGGPRLGHHAAVRNS